MEQLPDYGDLIPLDEFKGACDCGAFIDYDGFGHYATKHQMDGDYEVRPSNVVKGEVAPEWATHVMWFNR